MLKKLLIATVAVVAGLTVLSKVTKISPLLWWKDACCAARNMVPPETQLRQLNAEIGNIDRDIKKNISRVASMENSVETLGKELDGQRTRLTELRSDIEELRVGLEKPRAEKVAFHGRRAKTSELTRRLDRCVTEFTCLKERVKAREKLLEEKNRTLEVAKARLTEMKNEKEKLTLVAARLASHLEAVKMQQMESQINFDNSAIERCHELAADIEARLNTADKEARLLAKYGYKNSTSAVAEEKSADDVLKAARKALQDEQQEKVAADKEE